MTDWPRARADEIDQEIRLLIRVMMQGEATSEDIARMHRLQDERTRNMLPRSIRERAQNVDFSSSDYIWKPWRRHLVPHQPAPDDTQPS